MKRSLKEYLLERHCYSIEILRHLDHVCRNAGYSFMLIGAQARDLLLVAEHQLNQSGTTLDIDIAVTVDSWEQFHNLKDGLLEKGFQTVQGVKQRLIYQSCFAVDIVPFGKIANQDMILWPPDADPGMSVIGFEDVYKNSRIIGIEEGLNIHVCSLAGLTILKTLSWHDRKLITRKDGEDLCLLMKNYLDAGNVDRVYDSNESWILEKVNFNYELASALLLGKDVCAIASDFTRQHICQIIDRELEDGDELLIQTLMLSLSGDYELARNILHTFRLALDPAKETTKENSESESQR